MLMARPAKSRQRIIDHGEVFTPPGLVNDMLDLIKNECERIDSRFLEPLAATAIFSPKCSGESFFPSIKKTPATATNGNETPCSQFAVFMA